MNLHVFTDLGDFLPGIDGVSMVARAWCAARGQYFQCAAIDPAEAVAAFEARERVLAEVCPVSGQRFAPEDVEITRLRNDRPKDWRRYDTTGYPVETPRASR